MLLRLNYETAVHGKKMLKMLNTFPNEPERSVKNG